MTRLHNMLSWLSFANARDSASSTVNACSYSALPTTTAAAPVGASASRSSSRATPPDAITGQWAAGGARAAPSPRGSGRRACRRAPMSV